MLLILALLIGGGAIIFGILNQKHTKALKQACTARASGVVTRVNEVVRAETYEDEEEEDEDRRIKTRDVTWYYPVFEFSAGGRSITKTGDKGTGSPRFKVGEHVTVLYNPTNPEEFHVAEDVSDDKLGLILILTGVGIIVAGIVLSFI